MTLQGASTLCLLVGGLICAAGIVVGRRARDLPRARAVRANLVVLGTGLLAVGLLGLLR
ncbi:hypothetical protein J2W22_003006 [Sphingomonas kyeonggiensis]|uniref:hypothetical protein n=1 Tax=Sphingomonas kyeonggiensis TaxID=1268553 RepID=UPI0027851989|nr:hypothetical protein [Sphingomonas kyeonggiensis]MDQ0250942.1 hypothetical protein [Sphingomonas kyeonggiensis]